MTKHIRVVIETGSNRVFASAIDWPGWSRSAKSEKGALAALVDYAERYRKVAQLAGARGVEGTARDMEVVEHLPGTATTDFGAPDAASTLEDETMTSAECERQIALLRACWTYFDDTVTRVSEELRKGPRGGGRNRSKMVAHVLEAERSYARQIGVRTPKGGMDTPDELRMHRDAISDAIREINEDRDVDTKWPVRYFVRRAAWHVLDHAWEMEDKDLAGGLGNGPSPD